MPDTHESEGLLEIRCHARRRNGRPCRAIVARASEPAPVKDAALLELCCRKCGQTYLLRGGILTATIRESA